MRLPPTGWIRPGRRLDRACRRHAPAADERTVEAMESTTARQRTIFIADDAPSIRERLVELVEEVEGTRVVGEAETPEETLEGVLATRPDCLVLDLHLRGGTGFKVLRQMQTLQCEPVVVVLTNHPEPAYRAACLASGAEWFFDKSREFEKVRAVVAGIAAVRRAH